MSWTGDLVPRGPVPPCRLQAMSSDFQGRLWPVRGYMLQNGSTDALHHLWWVSAQIRRFHLRRTFVLLMATGTDPANGVTAGLLPRLWT